MNGGEQATEGGRPAVTVLLVDDEPLTRRGVRALLGPEVEVIEAATAAEAMALIGSTRPDVAIVEADLPDGDGIELVRTINREQPAVGCIVLTSDARPAVRQQAVIAGAAAFVAKDAPDEGLPDTVRRVAAGQRPLIQEPGQAGARDGAHRPDPLAQLSPQERRVVARVVAGHTNKQVAAALGLAETTVRNYLSTVLRKLGLKNRTELAAHIARAEVREHPTGPAHGPGTPDPAAPDDRAARPNGPTAGPSGPDRTAHPD